MAYNATPQPTSTAARKPRMSSGVPKSAAAATIVSTTYGGTAASEGAPAVRVTESGGQARVYPRSRGQNREGDAVNDVHGWQGVAQG